VGEKKMRLGPVEIGLILVIVLIVFGVGKLPQVGGALGKGLREFRQAVKGEEEHKQSESKAEEKKEVKTP
jgi:sec-independent protein translocase protein TatA